MKKAKNKKKPSKFALDIKAARKVLKVVDAGLCEGNGDVDGDGKPTPGAMCVEEAVCFAFGWENSDNPKCVAQPDRRFKMNLNDESNWGTNKARARGLRLLSIAQLGTRGKDREKWASELCRLVSEHILREAVTGEKNDEYHSIENEYSKAGTLMHTAIYGSTEDTLNIVQGHFDGEGSDTLKAMAACALEAYRRTGSKGYDLPVKMKLAKP